MTTSGTVPHISGGPYLANVGGLGQVDCMASMYTD